MAAVEFHAGDDIAVPVHISGPKDGVVEIELDLVGDGYIPTGQFDQQYTRIHLTAKCTSAGVFEQDDEGRIIMRGKVHEQLFGGYYHCYCVHYRYTDGTQAEAVGTPDASFRLYIVDNWPEIRKRLP